MGSNSSTSRRYPLRNWTRPQGLGLWLLLLFCLLQTGNDQAWSQSQEEPNISLKAQNQPLGEVVAMIAQETGYDISLNDQWQDHRIDTAFRDKPLEKALKYILSDFNHAIFFGPGKKIRIIVYAPKDYRKSDSPPTRAYQPEPPPEPSPEPPPEPPVADEREVTVSEEPEEVDEAPGEAEGDTGASGEENVEQAEPETAGAEVDAGGSGEGSVEQPEQERMPEDQPPASPQNQEQTN